jgi:hypothetical protein
MRSNLRFSDREQFDYQCLQKPFQEYVLEAPDSAAELHRNDHD